MAQLSGISGANDRYFPKVAVAALDILGVKTLLLRNDGCQAALHSLSIFLGNASSRGIYEDSSLRVRTSVMYKDSMYLGDSVYLFADPSIGLEQQVQFLSLRVSSLIAQGIRYPSKFLLRAAIAVGDLRERTVKGDSAPCVVKIGTAMMRAHALQEAQDWIGGAIAADVPLNDEVRKWTCDYSVPVKDSVLGQSTLIAINWFAENDRKDQILANLKTAFDWVGFPNDPVERTRVQNKRDNTQRFVQHVFDNGQLVPMWF